DAGRLFENAVLLELRRRNALNEEINYWRNKEGIEVDFIVRKGTEIREAIQVAYSLDSKKTRDREIRGLVECSKSLGIKRGWIITSADEGTETVEGIHITFIPLWKWLLKL
ncbi:ATP-binding protein, partial [Candidatus Micrarchaeota archaeon]|nr:ATP-binding protein [Candidatus Micrarchaeota archaeon]